MKTTQPENYLPIQTTNKWLQKKPSEKELVISFLYSREIENHSYDSSSIPCWLFHIILNMQDRKCDACGRMIYLTGIMSHDLGHDGKSRNLTKNIDILLTAHKDNPEYQEIRKELKQVKKGQFRFDVHGYLFSVVCSDKCNLPYANNPCKRCNTVCDNQYCMHLDVEKITPTIMIEKINERRSLFIEYIEVFESDNSKRIKQKENEVKAVICSIKKLQSEINSVNK